MTLADSVCLNSDDYIHEELSYTSDNFDHPNLKNIWRDQFSGASFPQNVHLTYIQSENEVINKNEVKECLKEK